MKRLRELAAPNPKLKLGENESSLKTGLKPDENETNDLRPPEFAWEC